MQIAGKCHCGNISYALDWPGDGGEIRIRAWSCSFCTKQGGNWTSHRDAALVRTATRFDGEGTGERLERRKRNWLPRVRISGA